MVAKDDDGTSVRGPGLILDSKESIRSFARSIQRQNQTNLRNEKFKPSEFEIEDYIVLLDGHNLNIQFDF